MKINNKKVVQGTIAGAAGILLLCGGAGTFAAWNSSTTLNGGQVSTGELYLGSDTTAIGATVTHATGATDGDANSGIAGGTGTAGTSSATALTIADGTSTYNGVTVTPSKGTLLSKSGSTYSLFSAVPGDTVTYEEYVDVYAKGTDLKAKFGAALDSAFSDTTGTNAPAAAVTVDAADAQAVTGGTPAAAATAIVAAKPTSPAEYLIDPSTFTGADYLQVPVTLTLTFPWNYQGGDNTGLNDATSNNDQNAALSTSDIDVTLTQVTDDTTTTSN